MKLQIKKPLYLTHCSTAEVTVEEIHSQFTYKYRLIAYNDLHIHLPDLAGENTPSTVKKGERKINYRKPQNFFFVHNSIKFPAK